METTDKQTKGLLQKNHTELEVETENQTGELAKVKQELASEITERKKTERKAKEAKTHFQALFNIMIDPVVIVDKKGRFLEVTDGVEKITGFRKEELLGKNFLRTKIITTKSKSLLIKNLAKRMMGMRVAPYEVEVLTRDGSKLPYEVNAAKINYMGKAADMVIFRDIAERKKAKKALEKAHDELEKRVQKRTLELAKSNELLHAEISERRKTEDELKKKTLELEAKVKELEEFHDLAVGRELKMQEMEKEFEKLGKSVGQGHFL